MLTDLFGRYAYPENGYDLPIVVVMHGFVQAVSDFTPMDFARMADRGLFVVGVSMRGRDGSSSTPDASGREIQDIADAVSAVRDNFAGLVSPTHAAIVGYSGGGGNAFAAAVKFPDLFNVVVSHFGMSDYGVDPVFGWHQQGAAGFTAQLETWVGGTPAVVPNNYLARDARTAITNYFGGRLYLFHDETDTSVPIDQSQRVGEVLLAAGRTNYIEDYTGIGDNPRWTHALPTAGAEIIATEDIWGPVIAAKTVPPWTIPEVGSLKIRGYIVTKRFSIWLGDGTREAADLTYETTTGNYTVTPTTGAMNVVVRQGTKVGVARNISTTTIIEVVSTTIVVPV